jgi:hypothetical protein
MYFSTGARLDPPLNCNNAHEIRSDPEFRSDRLQFESRLCARYIVTTAMAARVIVERLATDTAALTFDESAGVLTGTLVDVGALFGELCVAGTRGHVKVALHDAFCTPNLLNSNETSKP